MSQTFLALMISTSVSLSIYQLPRHVNFIHSGKKLLKAIECREIHSSFVETEIS